MVEVPWKKCVLLRFYKRVNRPAPSPTSTAGDMPSDRSELDALAGSRRRGRRSRRCRRATFEAGRAGRED